MTVTAVVVAGAGARGAYEAGMLSVLVPRLAQECGRDDRIVMIGTSAGAINAVVLSAFEDSDAAIARSLDLWRSITTGEVFGGLRGTVLRNSAAYAAQLVTGARHLRSLLDSSPLARAMEERLDWDDLNGNLRRARSWVHTAGVVTTATATRRTVVFVQGGKGLRVPRPNDERGIDYVQTDLGVRHVLASAAIPVAFLPVDVGQPPNADWHIDGGVRLNVPVKPALELGADRVVIVGTTPDPDRPVAAANADGTTDVFDVAGATMSCLLNDRIAEDVRSLRRTNTLVRASRGDQQTAYRVIPHLVLGPPDDRIIPEQASRVYRERYGGWRQLADLGVLGRLIGGSAATRGELLSYLLFDAAFHDTLIDLGRDHALDLLGPAGSPVPWRE
jgi:NTE family protein